MAPRLSATQARIIAYARRHTDLTPANITEALNVSYGVALRHLRALERKRALIWVGGVVFRYNPEFVFDANPTDDERLADAERSGLLAQRYSEALARGSTGEAAVRSARESIVSPDREDVTDSRMSETYGAHHAIKVGPSLTATERGLLNELPNELPIGFVSKALLYSPAIRHAAYTKSQRTALFKLIKRGLLRVERDRHTEYLVKVQPNAPRSGVRQRATLPNPKVTVFHANPRRRTGGRPILQSSRVYEIAYKHIKDGKAYKHPFKTGVCMELLPDGSIRIYSRTGKRLWKDFR